MCMCVCLERSAGDGEVRRGESELALHSPPEAPGHRGEQEAEHAHDHTAHDESDDSDGYVQTDPDLAVGRRGMRFNFLVIHTWTVGITVCRHFWYPFTLKLVRIMPSGSRIAHESHAAHKQPATPAVSARQTAILVAVAPSPSNHALELPSSLLAILPLCPPESARQPVLFLTYKKYKGNQGIM